MQDDLLKAFVGKDESYGFYEKAFAKLNVNGVPKFGFVWSWWAAFGGWLFLLYRKAYLPALGFFFGFWIISAFPFGIILAFVLQGGFSVFFVYKQYLANMQQINTLLDDKKLETMQELGGVNTWAIYLYATLVAIALISVVIWMVFAGAAYNTFSSHF